MAEFSMRQVLKKTVDKSISDAIDEHLLLEFTFEQVLLKLLSQPSKTIPKEEKKVEENISEKEDYEDKKVSKNSTQSANDSTVVL